MKEKKSPKPGQLCRSICDNLMTVETGEKAIWISKGEILMYLGVMKCPHEEHIDTWYLHKFLDSGGRVVFVHCEIPEDKSLPKDQVERILT